MLEWISSKVAVGEWAGTVLYQYFIDSCCATNWPSLIGAGWMETAGIFLNCLRPLRASNQVLNSAGFDSNPIAMVLGVLTLYTVRYLPPYDLQRTRKPRPAARLLPALLLLVNATIRAVGVGRVDVAAGKNTVISNRQFFDRGPVETGSNRVPTGLCSNQ